MSQQIFKNHLKCSEITIYWQTIQKLFLNTLPNTTEHLSKLPVTVTT